MMEPNRVQPLCGRSSYQPGDNSASQFVPDILSPDRFQCYEVPFLARGTIECREKSPSTSALSTSGQQSRIRLEWDRHKATIIQLYLVDGYRLEDVKQIMSTDHAFEASISRYKKRLSAWCIRKNYTRLQKEKAIIDLVNNTTIGGRSQLPTVNFKPLKGDRIARYLREQRKKDASRFDVVDVRTRAPALQVVGGSIAASPSLPDADRIDQTSVQGSLHSSWYCTPSDIGRADLTFGYPWEGVYGPMSITGPHTPTDPDDRFRTTNHECSNVNASYDVSIANGFRTSPSGSPQLCGGKRPISGPESEVLSTSHMEDYAQLVKPVGTATQTWPVRGLVAEEYGLKSVCWK